MAFAGAGQAQQRGQSRDDLLDALTRHIQICGEITDTQQRLSCYDRLQTQVGGVAAPAQPTPTPLQAAPAAPALQTPPAPTMGSSVNSAPLTPQPLGVPGGGVATLGGPSQPTTQDPNAAFDPRSSRLPAAGGGRPQAAAADAPHRSAAGPQFLDAAAAGDAGRDQPDLR